MSIVIIVGIVVAVIVIGAVVFGVMPVLRRRRLQQRLGPEYDRRPVSSTTASKRSSRPSRSSKIRCWPPGMAKTREPRNCALPSSNTARSATVSQTSPVKPELPAPW